MNWSNRIPLHAISVAQKIEEEMTVTTRTERTAATGLGVRYPANSRSAAPSLPTQPLHCMFSTALIILFTYAAADVDFPKDAAILHPDPESNRG